MYAHLNCSHTITSPHPGSYTPTHILITLTYVTIMHAYICTYKYIYELMLVHIHAGYTQTQSQDTH